MKLTLDMRIGILVGLLLVGDGPEGTAKKLFGVLHKAWNYIPMDTVCDGTIRSALYKETGLDEYDQ